MTDFSFLYRGREVPTSAEQMQKTTEKWMAWFKDLGAQGHIKELGHPLEYTGAVVTGKQKTVVDGPFAEAKDVIGGYTVIRSGRLGAAATRDENRRQKREARRVSRATKADLGLGPEKGARL